MSRPPYETGQSLRPFGVLPYTTPAASSGGPLASCNFSSKPSAWDIRLLSADFTATLRCQIPGQTPNPSSDYASSPAERFSLPGIRNVPELRVQSYHYTSLTDHPRSPRSLVSGLIACPRDGNGDCVWDTGPPERVATWALANIADVGLASFGSRTCLRAAKGVLPPNRVHWASTRPSACRLQRRRSWKICVSPEQNHVLYEFPWPSALLHAGPHIRRDIATLGGFYSRATRICMASSAP